MLTVITGPEDYEHRLEDFDNLVSGIEGTEKPTNASDEDEANAEDEVAVETGLDGETYVSPTYGFAVDWSGTGWEVAEDGETVDAGPNGHDGVVLLGNSGIFSIDGKADYDGDATDCVDGEVEWIADTEGVESVESYEEDGEIVEGRSAGHGRYRVYQITRESGDRGEDWMAYIECRPLAAGESVVIFTVYSPESAFEDQLDAAQEVIDTLALDEN